MTKRKIYKFEKIWLQNEECKDVPLKWTVEGNLECCEIVNSGQLPNLPKQIKEAKLKVDKLQQMDK